MSEGTSWTVKGNDRGTDGYRIDRALQRNDVRWLELPANWFRKNFDKTTFNRNIINKLMAEHIGKGGTVKGQRNAPDSDYAEFFSMIIEFDGIDVYIKFAIEPDDDDNPGLLVLNAHRPAKA